MVRATPWLVNVRVKHSERTRIVQGDWDSWVDRVFDRLDTDASGFVDLQEIMQCVPAPRLLHTPDSTPVQCRHCLPRYPTSHMNPRRAVAQVLHTALHSCSTTQRARTATPSDLAHLQVCAGL